MQGHSQSRWTVCEKLFRTFRDMCFKLVLVVWYTCAVDANSLELTSFLLRRSALLLLGPSPKRCSLRSGSSAALVHPQHEGQMLGISHTDDSTLACVETFGFLLGAVAHRSPDKAGAVVGEKSAVHLHAAQDCSSSAGLIILPVQQRVQSEVVEIRVRVCVQARRHRPVRSPADAATPLV